MLFLSATWPLICGWLLRRIAFKQLITMSLLESARQIVVSAWYERRTVVLDTTGNWHTCCRSNCSIVHLKAYVCMDGEHVMTSTVCHKHPNSQIMLVDDVYACKQVGAVHICDRIMCPILHGRCRISGQSCIARDPTQIKDAAVPKRARRRHHGVHTNEQGACILIYDLLFSSRRLQYELRRAETTIDIARRHAQRIIRTASRERAKISYQSLVNVYATSRIRMRSIRHLCGAVDDAAKQGICRHYAKICVQVWDTMSSMLPCRCTFEGTSIAVLYGMRRGVACDGIYAIPRDPFLSETLPDAHSIAEVGISRRSLTQSKNALFDVLQNSVNSGTIRVEDFSHIFVGSAECSDIPSCFRYNE